VKVVTGMSINTETAEGLRRLAKIQNRTFSNLCETILSEYVRNNLPAEKKAEYPAPAATQSPTLKRRIA